VNVSIFRSRPKTYKPSVLLHRYHHVLEWVWNGLVIVAVVSVILFAIYYVLENVPIGEVFHVFVLGLVTTLRVLF